MYADMEKEGLDSAGGGVAMLTRFYEENGPESDREEERLKSSGLPTAQNMIASAGKDEAEVLFVIQSRTGC
jgi:hypothetical protein